TPFEWKQLNNNDADLGSGATMLLPDQPGSKPHLLVEAGKSGKIYLLDRDKLGGVSPDAVTEKAAIVQIIETGIKGVWASPAFWNNIIYYQGSGDVMKAFQLFYDVTKGYVQLSPVPITQSTTSFGFPGAQPTLSSNGTLDGLAWALQTDNYGQNGPATLRVYNAVSLGQQLYNTNQRGLRDQMGGSVKFIVPTVTNGHVYVGTQYRLDVFGLFPDDGQPPNGVPSDLTATPLSSSQVKLEWTNTA